MYLWQIFFSILIAIWLQINLSLLIIICSFVLIQKNQKIKAVDSFAKKCSCSTQIVQTHNPPIVGCSDRDDLFADLSIFLRKTIQGHLQLQLSILQIIAHIINTAINKHNIHNSKSIYNRSSRILRAFQFSDYFRKKIILCESFYFHYSH